MQDEQIVITGTSIVSAAGIGTEQVFQRCLEGKPNWGQRIYRRDGKDSLCYPVYSVPTMSAKQWSPPASLDWLEETALGDDQDFTYLIAAIRLALEHAGLAPSLEDNAAALIVGHENLGVVRLADKLLGGRSYMPSDSTLDDAALFRQWEHEFFHLQTFPYLFYLSKMFGVSGPGYCINNACATGIYGLELGRWLIASGAADLVIVAASDYAHVSEFLWLQNKGFTSPSSQLRPFDAARDGSVLGDGAAAIVMESASRARSRQARLRCAYAGGSMKQDRWQMTLPDATKHVYAGVVAEAVRLCADAPVDLLVPHGTGATLWDKYEAQQIHRAFRSLDIPVPDVTAFKGYYGHALGASSLMDIALLAACVEQKCVLPVMNLETVDPRIELPLVRRQMDKPIHTAVKAVPAYGGYYAACVLQSIQNKE